MAYFNKPIEFVPPKDEKDRAQIYSDAYKLKECINSWSEFDLLRAYKDIRACIELVTDDVKSDLQHDTLQRALMNLDKIFMTNKNG